MSLPSSGSSASEDEKFSTCGLRSGESTADRGALGGWEGRSPVCLAQWGNQGGLAWGS